MPRKKSIPQLCHHKASGQARVRIDGRDHYLGKYGSPESEAAYDELIAKHLAEGRKPTGKTINNLLVLWWKECKARYSKSGKGRFGNAVCWRPIIKLMRETYGDCRPDQLGPIDIEQMIIGRATNPPEGEKPWSLTYCRDNLSRVKTMFAYWCKHDLADVRTLERIKLASIRNDGQLNVTEAHGPVDDALVERTLPLLRPKIADMVRLQRLTGMRCSELTNLKVEDIERESWTATLRQHKTAHRGKTRTIHFGPRAQKILERYVRLRTSGPVFRSRLEKAYSADSYRRAIERVLIKHNLPRWCPKQLRKSCAKEVRSRFDVETAASYLGHSSSEVTGNHYANNDQQRAVDAAQQIG